MLASETGYNKYYLCKLFKAKTGITINNYLTKRRIASAKQSLLDGLSVTDAGFRAGFHDLSHFIRTFKAETGISPGKYVSDPLSTEDVSRFYVGPETI